MNVMIGTVFRHDLNVKLPTAQWVQQQLLEPEFHCMWNAIPSNYIDAARNMIVEHVLAGAAWDYLFFLDSDIVPHQRTIQKLAQIDVPVAVGIVPIELNGVPRWNVAEDAGYWHRHDPTPTMPQWVNRAGTACMLIKREVFTKIQWPYFKTEIRHATLASPELVELTDDEYFCKKVWEADFEVWADPRLQCEHLR